MYPPPHMTHMYPPPHMTHMRMKLLTFRFTVSLGNYSARLECSSCGHIHVYECMYTHIQIYESVYVCVYIALENTRPVWSVRHFARLRQSGQTPLQNGWFRP